MFSKPPVLLATCTCFFAVYLFVQELYSELPRNRMNDYKLNYPKQQQYPETSKPKLPHGEVLLKMTTGKWVPLSTPPRNASYYDGIYHGYWTERKIVDHLWREDGKCGTANKLPRIQGSTWPVLPSWCNSSSDIPCCSNVTEGNCKQPSPESCDCPSCLDMRKFHHAEMCEWKTEEIKWYNHSGNEACDVIERSPFNSLHFVGYSLIRNMFYALLMILTDDPVSGAWSKNMNKQLKSYCRAEKFFFYKCRNVIRSLDMLEKPEKLCGGRKPNFSIDATISYAQTMENQFRNIVAEKIGKEGSIIFLHIGLHMGMNAQNIIKNYLEPNIRIRHDFYKSGNKSQSIKWPQIYFVPPLLPGLMKPRKYLHQQGKDRAALFADEIKTFCDQNDITFFDVRPFSKFVHSFDGTHYGLGVNLMKNQLMLNHFNSMV